MRTLLACAVFALIPGLAHAVQMLGSDARELLTVVCADEIDRFEDLATPEGVDEFWKRTPVPDDEDKLSLDAVQARAALGVAILDTHALKVVMMEAEKRSVHLGYSMRNAENTQALVECAMEKFGEENAAASKVFLGWLTCHRPIHENLRGLHEAGALSGLEYNEILAMMGVDAHCKEGMQ